MSFKDLLVVVDHARNCGRRIDLAARIARDYEAHLTGLYVTTVPYLQPAVLAEFPVERRSMAIGVCQKSGVGREESRVRLGLMSSLPPAWPRARSCPLPG